MDLEKKVADSEGTEVAVVTPKLMVNLPTKFQEGDAVDRWMCRNMDSMTGLYVGLG